MTIIKKTFIDADTDTNIKPDVDNNYVLAVIPFQGMFESMHSGNFDCYLESEKEYMLEELGASEEQADDYICSFGFTDDILKKYCIAYLEQLYGELDLNHPFIFEGIERPQFYNFTTDRIFAYVHKADITVFYNAVAGKVLDDVARRMFTSCDGYISSYNPCVKQWNNDIMQWDYNELNALITAYITDTLDEDWELYIMEDATGNGLMHSLCHDGISEEQHKIFNDLYEASEQRT